MSITYGTVEHEYGPFTGGSPKTSASIVIGAGDLVVILATWNDNNAAGNASITNSGSALTWNQFADVATGGRIVGWWAISPNAEDRTVTVAWDSGNNLVTTLYSIVHGGAHATNPIPPGNVFSGSGSAGVSQSITPTASGSALWLIATNAENTSTATFTPGAGCTAQDNIVYDTHDTVLIRPSTQPRTDGAAFTLSETHTGNTATVSWLAFEVQAAGAAAAAAKRMLTLGVG
jgi:hypothetical protein